MKREEAKVVLHDWQKSMVDHGVPIDTSKVQALRVAIEALSDDAVHGEWGHMIADGTDGSHWYEYECSHCGEVVLHPYNFCPNCGADMRGEDE